MTIKEITELRKSGKLQEATAAAEELFSNHPDKYSAGALFWCLFAAFKKQEERQAKVTVTRMKDLFTAYCADDKMLAGWLIYATLRITRPDDVTARKTLLMNYLNLGMPRPSSLHSLILSEAIVVEKNTPLLFRIRDFVRLWGLDNLREEDWKQFKTDKGITMPSTVEKLITVYAKELRTDHVAAPEKFSALLDKAMERYPDSQNLPHDKALVLMSLGDKDGAIDYYRKLLSRYPSKGYLWAQLSELIDNPETKMGMLVKAIKSGKDELVGNYRLALARLFKDKGLLPNAKNEIVKFAETYQALGWHLKPEFRELDTLLTSVAPSGDNSLIYAEYEPFADDFICSALPSVVAVKVSDRLVEDKHHPGKKIVLWALKTKDARINLKKPAKYGLNSRTPDGALFSAKISEGKIVRISPLEGPCTEPWLKEQTGTVHFRTDKNGNRYAKIDGTYVPDKLLKDTADDQTMKIISIQQNDGRWKAVGIIR